MLLEAVAVPRTATEELTEREQQEIIIPLLGVFLTQC